MDTNANNNRESFEDQQVMFVDTHLIQKAVEGLQRAREEFQTLLEQARRRGLLTGEDERRIQLGCLAILREVAGEYALGDSSIRREAAQNLHQAEQPNLPDQRNAPTANCIDQEKSRNKFSLSKARGVARPRIEGAQGRSAHIEGRKQANLQAVCPNLPAVFAGKRHGRAHIDGLQKRHAHGEQQKASALKNTEMLAQRRQSFCLRLRRFP